MRYLYVFVGLFSVFVFSCRKENQPSPIECAIPAIVPFQPFSNPVWNPNGNLLGFNHTPLAGVSTNGTAPCIWYMNAVKSDSTGFYLLNKDGTGFKRVTNFYLTAPSWSPDGNWITFSLGSNIYRMPFNGNSFDTTQIKQLTNSGGNFYPNWTSNSDSIYYDSNVGSSTGTYTIWKMAKDGIGKSGFQMPTRQPFIGSDNRIYYVAYIANQPEIFSMNKDGSTPVQITFNGKNGGRRLPKFYQNKVFFWDNSIFITPVIAFSPQDLAKSAESYDISRNGDVVYPTSDYGITDKRFGTLWLMNADGTNKRQLTFNHY